MTMRQSCRLICLLPVTLPAVLSRASRASDEYPYRYDENLKNLKPWNEKKFQLCKHNYAVKDIALADLETSKLLESARAELMAKVVCTGEDGSQFDSTYQGSLDIRSDVVMWLPLDSMLTASKSTQVNSSENDDAAAAVGTGMPTVSRLLSIMLSQMHLIAHNGEGDVYVSPKSSFSILPEIDVWLNGSELSSSSGAQVEQRLHSLAAPRFAQAACYLDDGARYVAHRDNKPRSRCNLDDDASWLSQRDQRDRLCTCILYLTPSDWDASRDGGCLRLYLGCEESDDQGYSAKRVVDVEPKCGRMVIFNATDVLHEVLPTTRSSGRLALTIWFLAST